MEVKTPTKINLEDWAIMAVPDTNGKDTALIKLYVKHTKLIKTPEPLEHEPKLFNNKVAIRRLEWKESFLERFEHASFDHPSIKEAEKIVALWPEVYQQMGEVVNAFNPMLIKGVKDCKDYPGSNSHQPDDTYGAIWATVHNPVLLAQAFVHEMAHNKLFALGQHFTAQEPLFCNADHELFDSPIRLDIPRPISAVFHGVYAFTHVLALDNILFEKGEQAYKELTLGLLKLNALRVKKGLYLIEKCAKLTECGAVFMKAFKQWANQEITKALETFKAHVKPVDTPMVIIGPNSLEKDEFAKQLNQINHKDVVYSKDHFLDVLSKSSIVKQKKIDMYGSTEVAQLFEQSEKFSNKGLLKNWLQRGVFNSRELEFMKLQLANHLLQNNPNAIICFEESHVFLQEPEFLDRLKQLFGDFNAKVIYTRPVQDVDSSVNRLQAQLTEDKTEYLHRLVYESVYRVLSTYTFDTDNTETKEVKEFVRVLNI